MIRITKGLDLPITGQPVGNIVDGPQVSQVALTGPDYIGMKPTMLVQEGDHVKLGQPVFSDKKTEGVIYTSPACGKVVAVNRGERRRFLSLVVEVEGDDSVEFPALASGDFEHVSRDEVTDVLVDSGLWSVLRTRPFSKVPAKGTVPSSIFVQAMDSNPLAADPVPVIHDREADFRFGVQALAKLTDGQVYVCHRPGAALPGDELPSVTPAIFDGPHPSGLPGTHIHFLDPVGPEKTVWYINYQDVIAIGYLMVSGQIDTSRVISLAGPAVKEPCQMRTRCGADISQLVEGRLHDGDNRVISGSVLSGRKVEAPLNFLGRYHLQVSAVAEGTSRDFLGWLSPGGNKFSIRNVFTSGLNRSKRFSFSTSTEGSKRAMVPIGMFEQVMPLDIIPTFLLRSLLTDDTEQAQALGCLELDEEDLSLCTFVCPGKTEYGPLLRASLTQIELDG